MFRKRLTGWLTNGQKPGHRATRWGSPPEGVGVFSDLREYGTPLYLYVYRRLIEGNVRLDRNAILEAKGIMKDLYDAWQAIIIGQDSSRPGDDCWEGFRRLSV